MSERVPAAGAGTGDGGDELDLRGYVRTVRRRLWVVVLATLVAVGVSVALSVTATPIYRAEAQLLLAPSSTENLFTPNAAIANLLTNQVDTAIQLLESPPLRATVAERLQMPVGEVPPVSGLRIGQTNVIRVRVEHPDPALAARIADTYAQAFVDTRREQTVNELLAAAELIQGRLDDIQAQIDDLDRQIAQVAADAEAGTITDEEAAARTESLQAERDRLITQLGASRQTLEQLQLDAALKTGGAQVVAPAQIPGAPVRPTPVRSGVLAGVLGLMLGVGMAFLLDYLDDTIRDEDDATAAAGLTVLARIPAVEGWRNRAEPHLPVLERPTSAAAEAYRSLRTAVQFVGLEHPVRLLQVTSPVAAEGKTTTLANLAVVMAQAGKRVLVVDCDLRRPRLHEFFDLDPTVGFTTALFGDVPVSEAVRRVEDVPRLSVLPSGPVPPNPSELLAYARTADLLRIVAAQFDVVLVDSPPVLPVTDATVLAPHMDLVLVVATMNATRRRQLARATQTLARIDTQLGLVLNRVEPEGAYGEGYGYYYAYGGPRHRTGRRGIRARRAAVEARLPASGAGNGHGATDGVSLERLSGPRDGD